MNTISEEKNTNNPLHTQQTNQYTMAYTENIRKKQKKEKTSSTLKRNRE